MKRTAFYPGSFDPVTNGHMDILRQACGLADKIVIAIGIHPGKKPFLTFEQRAELIQLVVKAEMPEFADAISVTSFDGLVVDACRDANATMLVRGLRDGTDLDYEMQMSGMNGAMAGDIQTVFCPASPNVRHITATLVRQIYQMGGDISPFVNKPVLTYLNKQNN